MIFQGVYGAVALAYEDTMLVLQVPLACACTASMGGVVWFWIVVGAMFDGCGFDLQTNFVGRRLHRHTSANSSADRAHPPHAHACTRTQ